MSETKLYKYLDAEGGLKMLKNSNLQFTNATQLNDPFDCHPALIDFSNVPKDWHVANTYAYALMRASRCVSNRNNAWICSLSKVYNSILMWAYYGNNQGVCIGLDMNKTQNYLSQVQCSVFQGAVEMEVQYKDIIEKPDYFNERIDYYRYQLSTKAKDWKHEQEVRLLLISPMQGFVPMRPSGDYEREKIIPWEEVRAYPRIGGECFDSIYLGARIGIGYSAAIIDAARKCNPKINIYQMEIDPKAFRLKEKLI